MIDPPDELAAAVCSLTWTRIDWLGGLGIPRDTILNLPLMVGVAKVQTAPDGFYVPDDDGVDAVIVAEGQPEPPIWDGLDDLIAFQPKAPGVWWRRRGEVKILGTHNLRRQSLSPIVVYETPLAYLRAGARGICIIDWSLNPESLMASGPLEAESARLANRIKQRAQEAVATRLTIPVKEQRNAA